MCNATNLSRIIAIHKNKATTNKLKTRDEERIKVGHKVDAKEKEREEGEEEVEEIEDKENPLKQKRRGEGEGCRSKKKNFEGQGL